MIECHTTHGLYLLSFSHVTDYHDSKHVRHATYAIIKGEDNSKVGFGEAHCHPKDRFTKEEGRVTALGFALGGKLTKGPHGKKHWDYSESPFTKEFREQIWDAYHSRFYPQHKQAMPPVVATSEETATVNGSVLMKYIKSLFGLE